MADDDATGDDLAGVLTAVGPRLRTLRRQRGTTLTALSATTGISVPTLSRLESGRRKPTLELLLPLAACRWTSSSAPRRPATRASTCVRSPGTARRTCR
jgi:DNA-binding XRE family transcriptional regulator